MLRLFLLALAGRAAAAAAPTASEWLQLHAQMSDVAVPLRARAEAGARAVEAVADALQDRYEVPAAEPARQAARAMRAAPQHVSPKAQVVVPEHEAVVVGQDVIVGRMNVTAPPPLFSLSVLVDGKTSSRLSAHDDMVMENIELGSHFLSVELVDDSTGQVASEEPTMTVFDVVPTREQLRELRLFPPAEQRAALQPPDVPAEYRRRADGRKTRLVLVGSQVMDGQKTLWLEILRALDRDLFDVDYVVFNVAADDSVFLTELAKLDVKPHFAPLTMTSGVVNSRGEPVYTAEAAVEMMIDEFDRHGGDVWSPRMQPDVAGVWRDIAGTVGALRPDVVLCANARDRADLVLQRAVRAAAPHARIIMDLPNLEPPAGADADVVVAPSTFALMHPSVAELRTGRPAFVINPGVDPARFWRKAHESRKLDPLAPVIGFLARVSPEKSPAMLVRAAGIVLSYLPRARFVVAGDGAARAQLVEYVAAKGLSASFDFPGFVSRDDVPALLHSFDVLVNPSLRSSETFCIANVEGLAAELPLVTFAAAGVGEYVRDGETGLVAWEPSPEALAREILAALRAPERTQRIAAAARAMVSAELTVERMVKQYVDLFVAPSWMLSS